jgi:actin-like ATPase involved in cell morphogenesis
MVSLSPESPRKRGLKQVFKFLTGVFGGDVGIDLGTANIVVYVKGRGIVINEPSAVAIRKRPRGGATEVIAVGREAKAMAGKTPGGVFTIWPLQDGVIANFEMTEELIRHCLRRANGGKPFVSHPRVVISVPAEVTEVERKAVIDATLGAGAKEAYVIEELIGDTTAEEVKIAIGSALPLDKELEMAVKGRDLADGLPKADVVTSVEVREALEPILLRIEDMVKVALEQTPPELAKDIVDQGIFLSGGVSLLRGLAERLSKAMNTPVVVAEDPLFAVARGVGKILENLGDMKKVLLSVEKGSK